MTTPPRHAEDPSARDLAVRLHQQGLVTGFGRFALRTGSMQEILDEASRVAAAGLEARLAKVLEYLPDERAFLVRSGVGWKPGVVGHARVEGDSLSPAGYAFKTAKPVVANDLPSESRFRTPRLLLEHGVRSAINVLVEEAGHSFGVLEVDSTHRTEFGDADVGFLLALANTLAAAIRAQEREDALAEALRVKEALLEENERLLRDKDLLIREVHHRVSNSLQLVHGALSIQTRILENREARQQVAEAASRVLAIAAVHKRLYRGGSVATADAASYLRGLLEDMAPLLSAAGERKVELDIESLTVSADDLAHLGLITVELLTNALKHGAGRVRIEVSRQADCLTIAVSDEGPGFPAQFSFGAGGGLGLKIVSSLAGQDDRDAIAVDRSVPYGRVVVGMRISPASRTVPDGPAGGSPPGETAP